jgi:endogenous inhibitor of DNA gyrase (YacG/DUF329 family)
MKGMMDRAETPRAEDALTTRGKRCPICGKPTAEKFRPFCGKRCKDVDLNRWLSGVYAVPGTPGDEDDTSPAAKSADEAG